MKNKYLALMGLAAFALSACGGTPSSVTSNGSTTGTDFVYKGKSVLDNEGPETGHISFQAGGGSVELVLWDRLLADFESKNPGIFVDKVTINDSDVLYTALAAGNAPDVIQTESPFFGSWAKKGALMSLQPYLDQEKVDLSDYWGQAIQMFQFDTKTGVRGSGDLFSLPKDFGVNGVFVNRKIINEAHTAGHLTDAQYQKITDQVNPMTFDEYSDIAVALTQYDGTANSIYGSNHIYWESYLWSLKDDILDSKYQLNYQSANVKKVLQYSLDMVTKGNPRFCAPYTASSTSASQEEMSLFTTGKMAIYWSGRWNVPSYDASNIDYYCIPCPVATLDDGTKGESAGWCSMVGYSISRNCTKTKMAYKLIKYLASADAYRIMNQLNYAVPALKSLTKEPEFADPKTNNGSRCLDAASAQTFFKIAEKAHINNGARFTTSRWIEAFESKLELLFTGDIATVDEFLSSVHGEVDAALKSSDPELYR